MHSTRTARPAPGAGDPRRPGPGRRPAAAAAQVTNGNFEANTGFIPTGYFNFFGSVPSVAGQGVGGSNAADFTTSSILLDQGGPNGSATINTVIGDTYSFTYSVKGAGSNDPTFGFGNFNADIGPSGGSLSGGSNAINSTAYTTFTSSYTATSAKTEISFFASNFTNGANHLYLDNVSLTDLTPVAVPEPSQTASLGLGALGVLGLLFKARRRKTAAA